MKDSLLSTYYRLAAPRGETAGGHRRITPAGEQKQKAVFYTAKGYLLACKRMRFTTQKVTSCNREIWRMEGVIYLKPIKPVPA